MIFVSGNHEFYRSFLSDSITAANALHGRYPNIHFLDDLDFVIGDVLFAGATLWTDFRLRPRVVSAATTKRPIVASSALIGVEIFEKGAAGKTRGRLLRGWTGRAVIVISDVSAFTNPSENSQRGCLY
ncbi:UNVERIFIED_ORG: hypothetical protein GGD51_000792 [Rhizobium esperanzae]